MYGKKFSESYREDYITLTNYTFNDKYSTSIFRVDEKWRGGEPLERFDRQPLPDYARWEDSGELNYMCYEARRDFPRGPWDECPGFFLPDKILDTCLRALPNPWQENIKSIAFLAWVSVDEVSK